MVLLKLLFNYLYMNTQIVTLKVPDMHCESCPKLIKMDLLDNAGVIDVTALLESKTVEVNFDSEKISIDKIISIIKESGYTASLLK